MIMTIAHGLPKMTAQVFWNHKSYKLFRIILMLYYSLPFYPESIETNKIYLQ